MKLVRNRADARWLPSRHNFALFRLLSWLRLRKTRPATTEAMFFVDRHQSAAETWTIGLWLLVTTACYFADLLVPRLHPVFAAIVGLWLSLGVLQVALVSSGLTIAPLWNAVTRRRTLPLRINSAVVMLLFFSASVWASLRPTWVRYVAWSALSAIVLNALAFIVVYLLRDSIAHAEASVIGGTSSER